MTPISAARIFLPLCLIIFATTGCHWYERKPEFLVPESESAAEQMRVAREQEAKAKATFDRANREEEYHKTIAAYDAVIKRFPSDMQFTPTAFLGKAELLYQLQDYDAAIRTFQSAVDRYPKIEDVRAGALWGLGKSHDKLRRQRDAQACYKMIIDEFSMSPDPRIRGLVVEARARYNRVVME